MRDNFFDKLAMLLSTDWFFPRWGNIGLVASRADKACIQQKCRAEVKHFIGNAEDYWNISFDEERMKHTERVISDAIDKYVVTGSTLSEIVNANSADLFSEFPYDLLENLTNILVSGNDVVGNDIPSNLYETVRACWSFDEADSVDYAALCAAGIGEWDRLISDMTPDLPGMLADFAALELRPSDRFVKLWECIRNKSDGESISVLADWYEATARHLTGENKRVPLWMR